MLSGNGDKDLGRHPTQLKTADPNKSTTALRALRVVEVLAEARAPLSASEVASIIETERSTAYRMLMTLMEAGYVVRDPRTRGYRLGYKILKLSRGLLSDDERTELIQECLREISSRTGEAVHYSVLDRDCAILVQRTKGTQLVAIDFHIGDRAALHCTSIGKLLLAYEDATMIEAAIRQGLPKQARNTITTPQRFRAELLKVRAQGYAYDDFEFADDMRCVAVPVFEASAKRPLGGISLSGPSSRFTLPKLRDLRDCAMEAVNALSLRLRGQG